MKTYPGGKSKENDRTRRGSLRMNKLLHGNNIVDNLVVCRIIFFKEFNTTDGLHVINSQGNSIHLKLG